MSFHSFALPESLLANLQRLGFSEPTPVQARAIPALLAGKDLLVKAQTGTGKTAAFGLPLLSQLLNEPAMALNLPAPRALVLTPTRELAQQVYDSLRDYGRGSGLKLALVYGGVPLEGQLKQLKDGVDLLVATPGRLLDHLKKRTLRLDKVQFLVFDEADRMLDMGFEDEIRALMKKLPAERCTALFSATFNDGIWRLAKNLLTEPEHIELAHCEDTAARIEERVFNIDAPRRHEIVAHLLKTNPWSQVLIFSRTKQGADALVDSLARQDIAAVALHADLSQSQRERNYSDFRQGQCRVLVATDVAARGLDVEALPCVINLELPFKREDYVHRIGRTGRAGANGLAITLLAPEDLRLLEELEAMLDRRLPQQWLPGFEPDLNAPSPEGRSLSRAAQRQRAKKRAMGRK
ncbi:DEAD/DEAH box helicase [Shewanella cyperi]|uniref:DEAD/DEAH box helicase n=1 Tax=Shewanella cyperi TaxID=2814292 RepID=UPI001A93D9BB|nr:DEAD/DEAH box helicase [Shewanella cyperi]QSX39792.1 DEAD/DEAH box helicase [Shewanella cyperi]